MKIKQTALVVISRFGLDEEENQQRKAVFCFSALKIAPSTNGIIPGARKLIFIFNFHSCDWMKIERTKGTRVNAPLPLSSGTGKRRPPNNEISPDHQPLVR